MFEHSYAYIFQGTDKRIVFAIPYEHDFTLIGTTDVEYAGQPADVRITEAEINYLCTMANGHFSRSLSRADVIWSYAGVRPLLDDRSDDAASVTRDYRLDLDDRGPPILSVFGGKLTTYRRLAEEAMTVLAPYFAAARAAWTARAALPGGDMDGADFSHFSRALRASYPWLPTELRKRLARAYGSRCARLLAKASSAADLGEEVLPGLHAREINYLRSEEWAQTADDILWRRSKLGLHLPIDSAAKLTQWLTANPLEDHASNSTHALLRSRA
jgi:glycerol-3-phosphate dehydrogenase